MGKSQLRSKSRTVFTKTQKTKWKRYASAMRLRALEPVHEVKMNMKRNCFEAVMTTQSCPDVRGLAGPVDYQLVGTVSRHDAIKFHVPPPARTHRWVGLREADYYAREFWETLSFVVIWVCGLIDIALCFR